MKKTMFAAIAVSFLAGSIGHAGYSSDAIGSQVTCSSGEIVVVVSKNRKAIIVNMSGGKLLFNIVNAARAATDGDTYRSYVGLAQDPNGPKKAIVSFDDQGDTLTLDGDRMPLDCP